MDGFNGGGKGETGESSPVQPRGGTPSPAARRGGGFEVPSISLPKGGGAIRGIGEKFGTNPVTGTGSLSVPIATSPGRSGFGPQLSLSYDSGSGNGPFGIGWSLSLPTITRKTDKGLPRYQDAEESDEFILSGAEDLVPVLIEDAQGEWVREDFPPRTVDTKTYRIQRYRPRIEGLFARIERWANEADHEDTFWRSISKDNITTWYGKTTDSRIVDNPANPSRIFSWLISESYDDKGNAIVYEYIREDSANIDVTKANEGNRTDESRSTNLYLKRIKYGNKAPRLIQRDLSQQKWLFEVVFDYDEGHYTHLLPDAEERQFVQVDMADQLDGDGIRKWPVRQDPFSSYRSGFEVRTYRLCHRVLMFHHFKDELGVADYLVRTTEFIYKPGPIASFITSVTQSGCKRQTNGTYLKKSLPPLEFRYTEATIQEELQGIDTESLENLPQGLDGEQYQWADLDGEGAGGILTEQDGAWFYKRNLSPLPQDEEKQENLTARFAPLERISPLPSFSNLSSGQHQLMDLAGDGQVDVVSYAEPTPGFFERTPEGEWKSFKPFEFLPNITWQDPNLKFVDLTGDGHADILITEDQAFSWYSSLAEAGFAPARKMQQVLDEEEGPRLVFADGTDSIYLSDMSGDGLTDLVRIRNGEVCYWPNLGYCRFGAKISMDNAPWFDSPDQFDQKRIRLADIDGSGVTDILYLKHDGVHIYLNESGNRWSDANVLTHLPAIDNTSTVMAVDLMGNGTACLVWSSPLSGNTQSPMRYVDLMGGQKPHLLTKVVNNLGAETHVHYAPSTKFYLKDKQQGKDWITRLHFPVHVVERVETYDHISRNRFVTRYAYHHGFFDGHEREFRGFAMVEQWDTEEFAALSQSGDLPTGDNIDPASHIPPIHTKTWFHTGVYLKRQHVSNYFAGLLNEHDIGEYFREPGLVDDQARALLLPDTVLPYNLSIDEKREACRALKGQMLRQEVYALDGTNKQQYPYTVTEQNFTIKRLQAKQDNPHAVFFTHAREALNYHYERNRADPRISHVLTLEVDNYGNVLKSVAVGYGRRPGNSPLGGDDRDRQEQTLVTYTENEVTNAINDPVTDPDNHRTPLPCESRTYELTDYDATGLGGRFKSEDFVREVDGQLEHIYDKKNNYEEDATSGKQRRLIERVRTLYRRNDLAGPLQPGELQSLAIPYESYKLAFTPGLLSKVYQRGGQPLLPTPADVLAGTAGDKGGYVDLEGDNHWWIPSGHSYFSEDGDINDPSLTAADELDEAQENFFLPRKYTNPFLRSTRVRYDDYDLLLKETVDALNNTTTVGQRNPGGTMVVQGNNYRVLQAEQVMGSNRNVTRVGFDALGLVVGTAVMGKPEDNPAKGDLLEDTFETDLTRQQIANYFADPRGQPAHDRLGKATNRIIYDVDRFYLSSRAFPEDKSKWLPGFAATIARETHVSDLQNGEVTSIQVSFSYSDGFGREIQKKMQAEKGKAPKRDGEGKIIVGADRQPEMTQNDVEPRWVGSGWTVYNNKGKPVRQFEPFFTDRHSFEFDVRIGVSPYLFYDPVGRVVATLHPNHTWEKVVFDPWHQTTYDVNDTVTIAPGTDDDINGFLLNPDGTPRLPSKEYLPIWYQLRTYQAHAPEFEAQYPDTTDRQHQTEAANKAAAAHANTPTTTYLDTLGRVFLTIAHNKVVCPDHTLDGTEDKFHTRVELDIEGNQLAVHDAVNKARDAHGNEVTDELGRIVMQYDYDMLGNRIHQFSMEAGARWMLNDVMGNPIRAWDSRSQILSSDYDLLRRPLNQYVEGTSPDHSDPRTLNTRICIAQIEYGEGHSDAIALNLLTRLFKTKDSAGVMTNEGYDFKGNLLASGRQLCQHYEQIPDWSLVPELEVESYISSSRYDALNRPVQMIAPHSDQAETKINIIQPVYNVANLLEKLNVWLNQNTQPPDLLDPATANLKVVTNIDYDAKGQRKLIEYGNGVKTSYEYDPLTFRLASLMTVRGTGIVCADELTDAERGQRNCPKSAPVCRELQNLHYTYDPVGNMTHIRDDAQQTIYFKNQCVEPSNNYTYDAIYRLIEATGREHLGQVGGSSIPHSYNDASRIGLLHPGDGNAMGRYCEKYVYDAVGNFQEMSHHRSSPEIPAWKRSYAYDETSLIEDASSSTLLKYSNRLSSTTVSNNTPEQYAYNAHGNMLQMPQLQIMQWDYKDQLQLTQRQKVNDDDIDGTTHQGERTYYIYDASGQRVRKVTKLANGDLKDERIYLGGFEIHHQHSGDNAGLVRETLHIMDDKQRIVFVERRVQGDDGSPEQLIRYQFNNHLGSAMLELDENAVEISYEEYTPYGSTSYQAKNAQISAASKRYRYSGKEKDEESGLYYYGARYYAPWLGRWLSSDPAGMIEGTSLYIFVQSNPVTRVDSMGFKSDDEVQRKAAHVRMLTERYGKPITNGENIGWEVAPSPSELAQKWENVGWSMSAFGVPIPTTGETIAGFISSVTRHEGTAVLDLFPARHDLVTDMLRSYVAGLISIRQSVVDVAAASLAGAIDPQMMVRGLLRTGDLAGAGFYEEAMNGNVLLGVSMIVGDVAKAFVIALGGVAGARAFEIPEAHQGVTGSGASRPSGSVRSPGRGSALQAEPNAEVAGFPIREELVAEAEWAPSKSSTVLGFRRGTLFRTLRRSFGELGERLFPPRGTRGTANPIVTAELAELFPEFEPYIGELLAEHHLGHGNRMYPFPKTSVHGQQSATLHGTVTRGGVGTGGYR